MEYFTILTAIGKVKVAAANLPDNPVILTQMAVGDGLAGTDYDPTDDQTALMGEVWRGAINHIYQDDANANWVNVEALIPIEEGPFTIREIGLFDADGDLIAIGKYPETLKPALTEGAATDVYVRMVIEVDNAEVIALDIDPSVVLATREWVQNRDLTIDDTVEPDADHGILGTIIHWFAFMLRSITGEDSWRADPATTLSAAKGHMDAVAPHSGHALVVHDHDGVYLPLHATADDSDKLDGQHGSWYVPPGAVMSFAMTAVPDGWLAANGAAVSRATYAALFAAIGTTFGIGDGAITFNLPDLRGEFIRGWDAGRGVDTGRTLGTAQTDAFKAHKHDWIYPGSVNNDGETIDYIAEGTPMGGITFNIPTTTVGGTETRPRNVSMQYCIKY